MKVAIIGSRKITATDIDNCISKDDELVSGGAVGVDTCAAEYAQKNRKNLRDYFLQVIFYTFSLDKSHMVW